MLKTYLKQIAETSKRGDAREESYYPVLKDLFEEYCSSIGKKKSHVTVLPKKTEAGNPDFRIWDGKQHITGYIEAKDPSVENLDRIEDSEQLKRYLHTFPNLILTNFLEFRLYRNGQMIDKVLIGRPVILNKLKITPSVEKEAELLQLFEKFFSFSIPKVYNAKTLAIELAKRTRFLKDVVALAFEGDNAPHPPLNLRGGEGGVIQGFYTAFKEYLISSLTEDEFSDLYAQTITYGLFAARTRSENGFNRKLAYDNIPQTIGILRDVFQFVSLGSLPQQMEWIIDDISEILSVTDINKILHEYFHEGKGKDPIIHFYETFLTEYDPKTRQMRGVYYTPEPVVSYIVRSLHSILKEQFNKPDGFADKNVTVLDPAAGTLTFLAETAKLAVDEFVSKFGEGGRKNFIKDHILKNFYAFELMMAPYAIGHLKMSFLLEELGYRLQKDDRVKLYLTNTLEMEELPETKLPGMSSLSEESHLAGKVKKEQPILVILGNPPYSVSSVNKSDFIEQEMDVYKEDVRTERNIQPLSDDYIKFIRFAHWKIEQDGKGIIGMITNNSYLSGLIHRGMRKKLLDSFDDIYILNLHGNSRIGEKAPDGSKDENVFDIQQGVSIVLFIKKERKGKKCRILYHDVYGLRENKYGFLGKSDSYTTKWKTLKSVEPYYFFVEKDFSLQAAYDKFTSISEIFDKSSGGVKTHRDNLVIGFTDEEIKRRMRTFTSNLPDDLITQSLNLKGTTDFEIGTKRNAVKKINWKEHIRAYSYRPFDNRSICYLSNLIDRDRMEIMKNFFDDNLGLVAMRQFVYDSVKTYNYVFCTKDIIDNRFFVSNRGICSLFPLYIYCEHGKAKKKSFGSAMMLFEPEAEYVLKKPNLSAEVVEKLSKAFKKTPSPEEIFYYIYAVLYSETYRIKYAEFLKIDFPRVPFTKDYKLFKKMSEYGNKLVDLHLLKSQELDSPIARFQGKGDNRVEKPKYTPSLNPSPQWRETFCPSPLGGEGWVRGGRVYINKTQYFEGISGTVWSYQIGGYQVCDKWLKDRKERVLSLDEIQTYCRIVTSIQKTIEIQKAIDEVYGPVEEAVV
ncbi:MAG: N-6 DNA methylase [Nitrospirae bacterium]|nr:N-6 DNA methylase [Nitrospirota bacterium]